MTLFRWLVLAASLVFAASSYAQDRSAPEAPAPRGAEKPADTAERTAAAPKQVIEISRSTKPNCEVKPVMTDDEIARCKKAWGK